jgi:hypothetical protein
VRGWAQTPRSRPARARNRRPWLTAAIAVVLVAPGVRAARAEVVFELIPDLALGVSENGVRRQPTVRDEFVTAGVGSQLRYSGARVTHALGNRLSFSHFFEGRGTDTTTDALTWLSTWQPVAALQLRLSASAAVSRVSAVDPGDLSATSTTAAVAGSSQFLSTTASEAVRWEPSARFALLESVTVGRVDFLPRREELPTTTLISGQLRAERLAALDTVYLDARLSDSYASTTELNVGTFSEGHNLVGQLLLGWRRQLSAFWSSELQGGPLILFRPSGDAILSPSGLASLNYQAMARGTPWFATVSLSRTPAANLFLGEATITDQLLARLALPLDRRQTLFVTGFAAYLYARQVGSDLGSTRLFDQITAGAALTARMSRKPFFASLAYTVVDQRGSTFFVQRGNVQEPRLLQDLVRRTLLLSAGAAFAWGPGTPQFFGGAP